MPWITPERFLGCDNKEFILYESFDRKESWIKPWQKFATVAMSYATGLSMQFEK